jgi:predicted amidophosphoribosyltransferase
MFCSTCGNQLSAELNFCNRCGKKVAKPDTEDQEFSAESLTSAVTYVGGFGLVGFIFSVLILVKTNVPEKALIMISLFYLAALFGICFMLLRQARYLADRRFNQNQNLQKELNPAITAQRAKPAERPISVTDHTTRTLEEVPVTFAKDRNLT